MSSNADRLTRRLYQCDHVVTAPDRLGHVEEHRCEVGLIRLVVTWLGTIEENAKAEEDADAGT